MDGVRKVLGYLVILSTFVYMTSQAPNSMRSKSLQRNFFKNSNQPTAILNGSSIHPCSRVNGGRRNFTVTVDNETVVCHKLNNMELLSVEKCPGSFQQKFAAVKLEKAIENAENMFGAPSSSPTTAPGSRVRVKRRSGLYMKPGETRYCNCKRPKSIDVTTNLLRPCGVCASIYRQANSNRFPQYVIGAVCHPDVTNSVFTEDGLHEIGRCVQKTISQDFLKWTGEWIIDKISSQREGKRVYKQEWETYTQTINSSCVFQFIV